jgi:stress-induced morphogen
MAQSEPRAVLLERALIAALAPVHLDIADESHMHSTGKGAESHFKVVIVSAAFDTASRIARHRLVYAAANAVFAGGLHALAVTARTPAEWAELPVPLTSPACATGT